MCMVEKLKLSTTISNVLSNKLDTFDFSIMFIIERPHEQAHYKKVYTVQKKRFFCSSFSNYDNFFSNQVLRLGLNNT